MTLKVGDTLYRFDGNRRIYPPGSKMGGPVFAGHFEDFVITDETARSWLCGEGWNAHKVSKATLREAGKGGYSGYQWYTKEGRDDAIWANENRLAIAGRVQTAPVPVLRRILALLDESPAPLE